MSEKAMELSLKQNTDFLKNVFRRSVFPCMLTILSANINVFVDGILVGSRLGADALAAINLSSPLYLALCVVGSFLAAGTAINAAKAIGSNETAKGQIYYSLCVAAAFWASVLITVTGLLFKNEISAFLCSDESIGFYVSEYITITLIGALPKIMIYVPFWYLRLDGRNAEVMIMMSVMSVGNVILDILFVYGFDLGVFGAGLASVIATTAAFAMGFIWLFGKKCFFTFTPVFHGKLFTWKEIVAAGTPSALNNLFSAFRQLLVNGMLMKYGGGDMVAVYAAVNGMAGFGECITLGIPQAASAMLGVYSGEKDNKSCGLLVRLEWIRGCIYAGIFLAVCMAGADMFQKAYGLRESLGMPLFWLAVSIFPSLLCNILSGYYNMADKNMWADCLIFLRVIAMTYVSLFFTIRLHLPVYSFLLWAELLTLILWFFATGVYHRKHEETTRYLLMDMALEKSGKVLNFSVASSAGEICEASERITEFCTVNGMSHKKTFWIQLALEEIMMLVTQINTVMEEGQLKFDLRAYSLHGVAGIRIRYGGVEFNPFGGREGDDLYMGIQMVQKMMESVNYQRTFGVNTLQVVMKEAD